MSDSKKRKPTGFWETNLEKAKGVLKMIDEVNKKIVLGNEGKEGGITTSEELAKARDAIIAFVNDGLPEEKHLDWTAIQQFASRPKNNRHFPHPKKLKKRDSENGAKSILDYADQMFRIISQRPANADILSREIDISEQMVFKVAQELVDRGYRIIKDASGNFRIDDASQPQSLSLSEHPWRKTMRILIWSGSELGSVGQQGDLLKTVYRTIVPEEKPDFVIALGNVIVGNLSKARLNETFLTETPGFYGDTGSTKRVKLAELLRKAQIKYVNDVGPDTMVSPDHRCKTHFISGLRERSFITRGFDDPLKSVCGTRKDWVYVGRNMHLFRVINTGKPIVILALTSKKSPFRGAYTRGHRPKKTGIAIAGWLINRLKAKGIHDFPHIIVWTDGTGVYTSMYDSGGAVFISLPKLSVTDPTELELDTPPNIGVVVLDLTFNSDGTLKRHGIQCGFRNLAPYVRERGY